LRSAFEILIEFLQEISGIMSGRWRCNEFGVNEMELKKSTVESKMALQFRHAR